MQTPSCLGDWALDVPPGISLPGGANALRPEQAWIFFVLERSKATVAGSGRTTRTTIRRSGFLPGATEEF